MLLLNVLTEKGKVYILPYPNIINKMETLKKTCEICGKEIHSLYPEQLEYNYKAHLIACRIKNKNKGENKNEKQ